VASPKDECGRALRGSQCQVQLYVNSPLRRGKLNAVVLSALPDLQERGTEVLDWRSPLRQPLFSDDTPFHEYRDAKMLRALDLGELRSQLSSYWPSPSPSWDALAIARDSCGQAVGYLLVEAKSYPEEFRDRGGGTHANDESLSRIAQRLRETREWLGVEKSPQLGER
jgi:hypothetical protein